jgi:hypothetical protein
VTLSSRQWVEISADGQDLTGVSRHRITVFEQLPLRQSVVSRLRGRLGTPPEPFVLAPEARVCPERLA